MVTPSVGLIVLVPFPFSDLSASKLRPSVVLAAVGGDDWVCVQVTSIPYNDPFAIAITDADFNTGSLKRASYARPGKLFTTSQTFVQEKRGTTEGQANEILDAVVALLRDRRH